jgi:hypothetical protein
MIFIAVPFAVPYIRKATMTAPESLLIHELLLEWRRINRQHFREALRAPLIALSDSSRTLGTWTSAGRTLSLSRDLVTGQPWSVVVEILKHEMAHQYVDEVLGAEESAHGPAFQQVCRRLQIDPAAGGLPEGTSRAMRKVQRLLALAGSDNAHEAEAAAAAARRLMLRHNLSSVGGTSSHGFRQLGTPTGSRALHDRLLAAILIDHFFVSGIWVSAFSVERGRRGRVLEICGSPENLEVACWMHGFLLESAERLWRAHQQRTGTPGRQRQRFLAGVMMGVRQQLEKQQRQDEEAGLIWLGAAGVEEYLQARHPRRRAGRASTVRGSAALASGHAAGRTLSIRRPVAGDGGPKLLS